MEKKLDELKEIYNRYEIYSASKLLSSIEKLCSNKSIDIAVFGQFKAGKSSFINSIVGKNILPTSVLPATSITTRIKYGENQKVTIYYNDSKTQEIEINEIDEYITEPKNPKNIKGVDTAVIELREIERYNGLCFTDTPGVGSVHRNNSQTAKNTFIETNISIVCVSAERPLSESDLKLFEELMDNSYKVVCLITKVDLFTKDEILEINNFVKLKLSENLNREIEVFNYSTISETDKYKTFIENEIFDKILQKFDSEYNRIFNYKLNLLIDYFKAFFEIAIKSAQKSDMEKSFISSKIFDEKTNFTFIKHEVTLIKTDFKNKIRDSIYDILKVHINKLVYEISGDFLTEYELWNDNLYVMTRKYESWLKKNLSEKIYAISEIENERIEKLLVDMVDYFRYFSKTFNERLSNNIKSVLGIDITSQEWNIEFKSIKKPDISIFRTFDSHIDLLWFLFPMSVFKRFFKKYFLNQIPDEVDKNIQRLTSDYTELINNIVDNISSETLEHIKNEINTIEKALKSIYSRKNEYIDAIEKLNNLSNIISLK